MLSPSSPSYTVSSKKELISSVLATMDRRELLSLIDLVRDRNPGSWENFLIASQSQFVTNPSGRATPVLLSFLNLVQNEEDLQLLAKFLRHTRYLVHDFSLASDDPRKSLVYNTLTHKDHHFDFLSPFNHEDWVTTGTARGLTGEGNDSHAVRTHTTTDNMLALCVDTVRCADGSDSPVRVVVVDSESKVILDELVKPSLLVHDYRTNITGLSAKHLKKAASLSVIQQKLLKLFSLDTIMVGHRLNKDLKALKMDHARLIDTSLAVYYNTAGYPGRLPPVLPRPALKFLCKSLLDKEQEESPNTCLQKATAVMDVVRAIVTKSSPQSITLTQEVLRALVQEDKRERNVTSKKRKNVSSQKQKKNASRKKQRGENSG